MLIIFKILFIAFAFLNIAGVITKMKNGSIGKCGSIFWIILWSMVIIVVFDPAIVQRLADILGIGRGSDLVVYIALALLFVLHFRLHLKIENMNRDVTKVVRKNALEEVIHPDV